MKANVPKGRKRIENDFRDCIRRKKFVDVDKGTYKEYVERAKDDFISAQRDEKNRDLYWAVIKAYQSIFFSLNSLIIREMGFFSKDHKCLLTALIRANAIDRGLKGKVSYIANLRKKAGEADVIRQERNIALYHPKSKDIISDSDAKRAMRTARDVPDMVIAWG